MSAEEEPRDPADHGITLIAAAGRMPEQAIDPVDRGQGQPSATTRADQQWDSPVELAQRAGRAFSSTAANRGASARSE